MSMRYLVLAIAAIVIGIALYGTLFTVHQTKQAIVMQFGEPKKVIIDPGLNWKIPFIQDVTYYEKRVLNLDPPVENMLLSDQKRLLVDSFARYRILDPLAFFQSVRSEAVAKQRLGGIINASLRDVLGNTTLASVLSEDRIALMIEIREHVNRQTGRFGIEIVDVRIRRADLPNQASQSVYARMQTEREREAAEFRAQGFEQAQRIKAAADREATVIQAEAKRESEILKGQGEGRRTEILNDAYGRDAGFFNFYRSMQAYEAALGGESTYMVLSPDSEFFDFFDQVERGARP